VVGFWHGFLSEARCRFAYGPAIATVTYCLLLQEIQIDFMLFVLPFWYWLIQVVLDKVQGPVKGCRGSNGGRTITTVLWYAFKAND